MSRKTQIKVISGLQASMWEIFKEVVYSHEEEIQIQS